MTHFDLLSELARAMFALWALLLCLAAIGSAVLAAVRKRYMFTASALALLLPCYFMWQIIFDISLHFGTDKISRLSAWTCGLPWIIWLTAFIILTSAAVLLLILNIRYDRNYITTGTIKLCLDKMPCGICCWRETGRVLFSNICMNQLSIDITGRQLLNGNQFRDAVSDGILNVSGKVWRFACREIVVDNKRLYEMIASDITAEYAKTEALKKDKTELSRLNSELSDYYTSIDESVKRQEILQAKMNIHDEMNRLMLSTTAADKDDTKALDDIFALWEQNALLLCMEADKKKDLNKTKSMDSLANALGIKLIWLGELPKSLDDRQRELFYFTAQEAIINAVKHARAKNMEISFEQTDSTLSCRFTNNGKLPRGEVQFEGGLANIALLAEKQGAAIHTEIGEAFTLVLCLPLQKKM